jgi:hypothetical protein
MWNKYTKNRSRIQIYTKETNSVRYRNKPRREERAGMKSQMKVLRRNKNWRFCMAWTALKFYHTIYLARLDKIICNLLIYKQLYLISQNNYSETSIHRFRQGSEKETMDPGKQ